MGIVGANQSVAPGDTVQLDGSASSDADKDSLTYRWSVASRPAGSAAVPSPADVAKPVFVPDAVGEFVIELVVNDGKVDSAPSQVKISAGPALAVSSESFSDGGQIPIKYVAVARGGNNASPSLKLANVPPATKYLAIVMDDETAPCGVGASACVHWGVFNLPPDTTVIPDSANLSSMAGVVLGKAYDGTTGYQGPNPPSDHLYKITVYALSGKAPAVASLPTPAYTRSTFESAYAGYILTKATWTGRFPK